MLNTNKSEVHLQSMIWYHGPITRETAEQLLQPREEGLFLIRESVNYPGDFTLCVCFQDGVQHYRIIYDGKERYTIDEEEYFASLEDLVEFYISDANGLVTCLSRPLPKSGLPVYPPVIHYFQQAGWVFPREGLILEECLGKGDFAEVFKAQFNGKILAAKCVLQSSSLTFVGIKEASVMTTVRHQNLVQFQGLIIDSDKIYLLTEYMVNGSLVNYLRTRGKSGITQTNQLTFSINIANGMSYLEQKDLVHRDLACRNILLDKSMSAKIADFGLCRETDSYELGGRVPIKWTAPEAVKCNQFSPMSDMWSFGVVLWEIYSFGKLPYSGISVQHVVAEIEQGYRLPCPPSCPAEIYSLMDAAWVINPAHRPNFRQAHKILSTILNSKSSILISSRS